jgi:hypothetical protein
MMKEKSQCVVQAVFFVVVILAGVWSAEAEMPVPTAAQVISYEAVESPVVSGDPHVARPIGVGTVTTTHDLSLQVELDSFPSPVDVYLALYAPALLPDLLLFHGDGGIASISAGLVPWKAETTGPVSERIFGTIPLSLILSGDYGFYLLVAPTGTSQASLGEKFYLWATSIENLRVYDVSTAAATLLGGDAEAAASILMALANGYPLPDVVESVNTGTISQYGEIVDARTLRAAGAKSATSTLCAENDPIQCHIELVEALSQMRDSIRMATEYLDQEAADRQFEEFITAFTLWVADLGYDAAQIQNAIEGTLFGGDTFFDFGQVEDVQTRGHIWKQCPPYPAADCESWETRMLEPNLSPWDLFSDLDPDSFPENPDPGTDGMTFPTYYKGTGSVRESFSSPYYGSIECFVENAVYVARVGGIGYWFGRLKVYATDFDHWSTGSGDLECRTQTSAWTVANGEYSDDGSYYEEFSTDTSSGGEVVFFNKDMLWGNAWLTETLDVYGGQQVTERFWEFRLQSATEEEYNAVTGDQPVGF